MTATGPAQPARRWLAPSAALDRFKTFQTRLMAPTAGTDELRHQRYGFRIGELGLLIESGTLSEVLPGAVIHPLPHAPAPLLGLINLRGSLVPVYEIGPLLEQAAAGASSLLLVLGRDEDAVALRLVHLPVALEPGPGRSPPQALPAALRDCATGACEAQGQLWLEFDHRRFFARLAKSAA